MTSSTIVKIFSGAMVAAMLLAGCGGGGSALYGGPPPPHPSPSAGNGVPLNTAQLNGAPGFVNGNGFTVYVFDLDLSSPGQSSCNSTCAQNWPPMIAPAGSLPSPYGSIARQDGTQQLTYSGRPLYTFAFDTAAGQTNGDGVNAFGGLWHIARPAAGGASPSPSHSGY